MALTTCNVTGRLALPDDSTPANGFVVFVLNVAEVDGDAVIPREVRAPIDANGQVELDLWPNSRGAAGSSYSVRVDLYPSATAARPFASIPLGAIEVPEAASAGLAELLDLPAATPIGTTVLAQIELARAAAAASADAAEIARDQATAAATRPAAGGPVACATTADISLSGAQTIDGAVVTAGSRVLVKDQIAPAENGIWIAATGAWARAGDMDAPGEFMGTNVFVAGGTTNAGRTYYCSAAVVTVDVDPAGFDLAQDQAPLQAQASATDTRTGGVIQQPGAPLALTDAAGVPWLTRDAAGQLLAAPADFTMQRIAASPRIAALFPAVGLPTLATPSALVDSAATPWLTQDGAGRLMAAAGPMLARSVHGQITSRRRFACWGDSMTQGVSDQTPYTSFLAALTGYPVWNFGKGGQTSDQIAARQGGLPIAVTVSGDAIPASGGVAVSAKNINILIVAGAFTGTSSGRLCGVPGSMSTDASGNWTFSRTSPGASTACPSGSLFVPDDAGAHEMDSAILWAGRNDTRGSRALHVATRDNILAMTRRLRAREKRFLVVSICTGPTQTDDTDAWKNIHEVNAELADVFGERFCDLNSYMAANAIHDAGLTPTSDDLTAMAGGTVPPQLIISDPHYTTAGNQQAAGFIHRHMLGKGLL